jgi:hypothetical protein
MAATGLSADPAEYRARLVEQPDNQIDGWAAELMRDMAKRKGVVGVIASFRQATGLSEPEFERVFASGGGSPATVGRDAEGRLIVPAVSLWALVPGLHQQVSNARERLIDYLVASFHELVYV